MIETREIKMPPKKLLSVLLMQYGLPWIAAAGIGLIVFVVLGFSIDYRFFILALIWLFLLTPLVVAFLYFFYAMDPLTAFNAIPHKIIDDENRLRIRFIHPENQDERPTDHSEQKDYLIEKEELVETKSGPDYFLLFFRHKGWIWLPINAFNQTSDLKSLLQSFPLKTTSN